MGSSLRTGRTGPGYFAAGLIFVAGLGVLASHASPTLGLVAFACAALQAALAYVLVRGAAHPIALTSGFALTWLVTYTLRLWQIGVAPDPRYHHPAILLSDDTAKSGIWVLTTLGFASFVVGALLVRKIVPRLQKPRLEVDIPRHAVVALFYTFLAVAYALALSGFSSGFVANISQFYLFVIAYASYRTAEARRSIGPELAVVLLASSLGVLFGIKEFAVLPVVAWFIGQLAARRRVFTVGGLAVLLIGVFFYVGIQSQRAAEVLGEDTEFVPALRRGITNYDLVTGTYLNKTGSDIAYNVLAAMGSRLTGVDALFVLDARVPEVVPFQYGKTVWQPLLSIVPGTSSLTSPELSALSLGRYTTQTFWSLNPGADTSSQPLTVVGDLWLNFRSAGVVLGLLAFGALYQFVELRTGVSSATTAGLFAYAALPMLAIERNIAYLLVTGSIRYAFGLLLIRQLKKLSGRQPEVAATAVSESDDMVRR